MAGRTVSAPVMDVHAAAPAPVPEEQPAVEPLPAQSLVQAARASRSNEPAAIHQTPSASKEQTPAAPLMLATPPLTVIKLPPAIIRAPRPDSAIAATRAPDARPPTISISETNLLGKEFQLTSTRYWLNGKPLAGGAEGEEASHETLTARAAEGRNVLEVQAAARGTAHYPLKYLNDLEFGTSGRSVFNAHAGDRITVDSVLYEDGDLRKEMVDRMHLDLNVAVAPRDVPAQAER
jgi:hypothetical protein